MQVVALAVINIILLVLIGLLSCKRVSEHFSAASGNVGKITFLWMKGCGWCTKMTPVWNEFTRAVPTSVTQSIEAGEITPESKRVKEVARAYGFKGYPFIMHETPDGAVRVYNGDRSLADLLAWSKL